MQYLVVALSGTGMSDFLTQLTSVVTWVISTFTSVASFIVSTPLLFLGVVVSLVGTVIWTIRRMI